MRIVSLMVPMGVCAGIPTLVSTLLGDPMGEPIVGEANMLMYGWLPRVAVTTLPNRQQLSIHQLIVGIFYAWALMHVLCVAARARACPLCFFLSCAPHAARACAHVQLRRSCSDSTASESGWRAFFIFFSRLLSRHHATLRCADASLPAVQHNNNNRLQ